MKLHTPVVLQLCTRLDHLQKKSFLQSMGHETPPQELEPGEALLFWAFDALLRTTTLSDTVLRVLLKEYSKALTNYANAFFAAFLAQAPDGLAPPTDLQGWGGVPKAPPTRLKLPELRLGIIDFRNYAVCDGEAGFLNLRSGEVEVSLATPEFITTSYNMGTLLLGALCDYKEALRPRPV